MGTGRSKGQTTDRHVFLLKDPGRIMIIGMKNAGKATIVREIQMGRIKIQSKGFSAEITEENVRYIGGRVPRPAYIADAIIYVVDSTLRPVLGNVKDELTGMHEHELLQNTPFLILANKQDLPEALGVSEVAKEINFDELSKIHTAHIVGCSALTGDSLSDGLEWLANQLLANQKPEPEYSHGLFKVLKSLLPIIS